jgi:20S proteasome alpha/beta subunit
MTAIAGFRCQNGVVICADSELNYGLVKSYAKKIRGYGSTATAVRAALTGAGDWDDIQRTMGYVEDVWPQILAGADFVTTVADRIKEIYAQPHANDWNGVSLISAYWKAEAPAKIFKFTDTGAVPVPTFVSDGMGIAFSQFLAGTLYDDGISLRHGVCLAAYILYAADKFASECGGLGDIFTLTDKGWMDFELEWDMQAMREFFERLPSALRPIILEAPDNNVSASQFSSALELFTDRLTKLRKQAQLDTYERGKKYGHLD